MDLTQLANLGEFVGGVAVLVTLIYLAVQIGGSKKALKTQTHHNLIFMAQRPWELMLQNDDLADVVTRGHQSPEALSDRDSTKSGQYTFMLFNAWEYGYYLNRDGSTPSELRAGVEGYYRDLAASKPGMLWWWRNNEHSFAEPFRSYARSHFSLRVDNGGAR